MAHNHTLKAAVWAVGAALASPVLASGYHFGAQSVAAMGTANAGAAEAGDPSVIYYNPAGLTQLEGTQVSANLFLVAPHVTYDKAEAFYNVIVPPELYDKKTRHEDWQFKQEPVEGKKSGIIANGVTPVPQTFASHRLNDTVVLGFGAYVPFASGTEYGRDSVLRYNINKTQLKSFALNPAIAFRFGKNHAHSFGFGIVAQHLDAKLRQYADYAAGIRAQTGAVLDMRLPRSSNIYRVLNRRAKENLAKATSGGLGDGFASIEGSGWGWGYQLGYTYDLENKARFGISYRSSVKHRLDGKADWNLSGGNFTDGAVFSAVGANVTLPAARLQSSVRGLGYVTEENGSVKIVTPESLSLHGMLKASPRLEVFGNLTYTRHSRFKTVRIEYENEKTVAVATPDNDNNGRTKANFTEIRPNWRNTWSLAVGGAYRVNDALKLRAGVSFDKSPIRSADLRLSTMPDNNRLMLSLGAGYDVGAKTQLNLSYSFLRVNDSHANVNGFCGGPQTGEGSVSCVSSRTSGSAAFKSHAHIVGVSLNHRFQ